MNLWRPRMRNWIRDNTKDLRRLIDQAKAPIAHQFFHRRLAWRSAVIISACIRQESAELRRQDTAHQSMLAHAQCDCRFRSRCKQFECFNIVTSGSCSPNNLCDRTSGIRPHLCDPRRKSRRPSTKIMKRKYDSSRIQFSHARNPRNFTRGISHRSARVIGRQFHIDVCRRRDRTARGAPSCDALIITARKCSTFRFITNRDDARQWRFLDKSNDCSSRVRIFGKRVNAPLD